MHSIFDREQQLSFSAAARSSAVLKVGPSSANLFRATQTEEKLRRENIKGKEKANRTHWEVGAKVRQTIKELGGTMPEHLPVAEDIKRLETKQKKAIESKDQPQDGNE
jgi:DNA-damage-inducible protein D